MQVKFKLWFEDEEGNYLFGEGLYELLSRIYKHGNIMDAVKELNMSYRYGWGKIKNLEKIHKEKIIETRRGGKIKGSATLTDYGMYLLKEYERYFDLFNYYIKRPYKVPSLAVDGVIIKDNKILLIKRKNDPFAGMYALPGGFVEYNETVENSIEREIYEETGLISKVEKIVGVYSSPERDPRGHTISIAYIMKVIEGRAKAGDDAKEIQFFSLDRIPVLAFDHNLIVNDAIKLLNKKA